MNVNDMIKLVIGVVVGVLMVSVLLIPVIGEATETHTTFENESYYALNKITADTDVTIKWDKTAPTVLEINGEDFTMPADLPKGRAYTIVGSETAIVRYFVPNSGASMIEYASGNVYANINVNDTSTYAQATINGNSLTFYADFSTPITRTATLSGDSYYLAGDSGDYTEVMKDGNTPAYVNKDSIVHLIGTTTPVRVGTYGIGSIEDGLTMSTLYKAGTITSDVTYSTPVATYTEVAGYEDLYLLDHYDFTISYDDTTENAVYSYFIIPAEVTAEKSVHADAGTIQILEVIPLLITVGLIVGIVGVAFSRRE